MKMYFKQRLFSWFDCYDIYDEDGHTLYRVEGQLSWGHCLKIFDTSDQEVGRIEEKLFRLLPKFEMYAGIEYIGCISRDFSWFRPSYYVDCKNWQVKGSFMQWDYQVLDFSGNQVASIYKELLHLSDTYVIEVNDPDDALYVLMLVLAIDAEKCSSGG